MIVIISNMSHYFNHITTESTTKAVEMITKGDSGAR